MIRDRVGSFLASSRPDEWVAERRANHFCQSQHHLFVVSTELVVNRDLRIVTKPICQPDSATVRHVARSACQSTTNFCELRRNSVATPFTRATFSNKRFDSVRPSVGSSGPDQTERNATQPALDGQLKKICRNREREREREKMRQLEPDDAPKT
ncbi:unnamed protein product [Protopolystoma xenopodis]|uniref:Uncharacterized protein n=1 Tax=Protopolystoma xenopodis TaxID=117903 RepID=A0A3S5B0I1_9PLAT|nr:unnamed protein product [Protopolystoma xenopodis]